MPVILTQTRKRQEDLKFKASLGYKGRSYIEIKGVGHENKAMK